VERERESKREGEKSSVSVNNFWVPSPENSTRIANLWGLLETFLLVTELVSIVFHRLDSSLGYEANFLEAFRNFALELPSRRSA